MPARLIQEHDILSGDHPGHAAVLLDHKTEVFLHRREIVVIVQQRVPILDTEGADDDVRRLADRNAQFSQLAVVPGGMRGKIGIQKRHENISAQSAFNAGGVRLVPGALKNLEQDEITD